MVQREVMPTIEVQTAQRTYESVIERGLLRRLREWIPAKATKAFIVTTPDVWDLYGNVIEEQFERDRFYILFFPGGEANKRLSQVEELAEQMIARGADRTSVVIGFGGGIVTDVSGFLAAIFMRGVPVLQIPTTLLAQVDAAVGGKTGVNLVSGKNLIGSFHQPLGVLIDPEVLQSLPEREYRAGLFEVIKCGVIRDRALFETLETQAEEILHMKPELVDHIVAEAVRIKSEVVSADERESDLRRILNFGHTIGHAIEAETEYVRFLHGEAVALGMLAATRLAELLGMLSSEEALRIQKTICAYGPIPPADDLRRDNLLNRLGSDKKTLAGKVHFVLPTEIGHVTVRSGIDPALIRRAMSESLHTIL